MHSVLVIGCGSIGERHLRCFQATKRTLVTACDSNPALLARMAEVYRVPTVADASAALQSEYDAVVICTPAHLHIPMATRAIDSGKHVLVEKPLSQSLAGLPELFRARARSQMQVAVAYVMHVYPFMRAAKEFLDSGEFGPVLHASVTAGQPFHVFRPAYSQTYYRDHRTGGGGIQDALTHLANWTEGVIGPADSVYCDCAHLALPNVEVEDTVTAVARHGRTLASYSLNQFQAPNESTLQFNTAQGSVRVEIHHQRWGKYRMGDPGWTWHSSAPIERDTHFIDQADAFLDQIEGRPSRLCTLEAAAQTLRFNLAMLASAGRGARVSCQENFPDV